MGSDHINTLPQRKASYQMGQRMAQHDDNINKDTLPCQKIASVTRKGTIAPLVICDVVNVRGKTRYDNPCTLSSDDYHEEIDCWKRHTTGNPPAVTASVPPCCCLQTSMYRAHM